MLDSAMNVLNVRQKVSLNILLVVNELSSINNILSTLTLLVTLVFIKIFFHFTNSSSAATEWSTFKATRAPRRLNRCMTSKYRESRALRMHSNCTLAVLWCHTPNGQRSAASVQTHILEIEIAYYSYYIYHIFLWQK